MSPHRHATNRSLAVRARIAHMWYVPAAVMHNLHQERVIEALRIAMTLHATDRRIEV